jgi:hypothetical protein
MRGEEMWAQQLIALALGVDVHGHDDNSAQSMYDLRVGPSEAPEIAIEVVGAVDREWTETWNVGPAVRGKRWNVVGDWMITIRPGTRIKTLQRELLPVISALERLGVHSHRAGRRRHAFDAGLDDALESLGVQSLHCLETNGTGTIHMTMPGEGGMVHEDGNLVADWVVEFLKHEDRADVLHKLALATTAARREVFIAVTLMGAPWSITSYLTGTLEQLPGASPLLPAGVDGVWLAATISFHESLGIRWVGTDWSRFRLRGADATN